MLPDNEFDQGLYRIASEITEGLAKQLGIDTSTFFRVEHPYAGQCAVLWVNLVRQFLYDAFRAYFKDLDPDEEGVPNE